MWNWIKSWFAPPCQHEWETIKTVFAEWEEVRGYHTYNNKGWLYTLRCKKCGDITSRKVG